jgi:hypothetical protein
VFPQRLLRKPLPSTSKKYCKDKREGMLMLAETGRVEINELPKTYKRQGRLMLADTGRVEIN